MNAYIRPAKILRPLAEMPYIQRWPCGWHTECYLRVLVERKPAKMRLVTQTSSPIGSGIENLTWHAPKIGAWQSLIAVFLDAEGKLQTATWSPSDGEGALLAFRALYDPVESDDYIKLCLKAFAKGRRRLERLAELRAKEIDLEHAAAITTLGAD